MVGGMTVMEFLWAISALIGGSGCLILGFLLRCLLRENQRLRARLALTNDRGEGGLRNP